MLRERAVVLFENCVNNPSEESRSTGEIPATVSPRRFLVIGMQRSGTTVVHQILSGHPDVLSNPREAAPRLFYDYGAHYFNTEGKLFPTDNRAPLTRAELVRGYFDLAVAQAARGGAGGVRGLKVAIGSGSEAERMTDAVLSDFRDLKIVVVERRDGLAACVSFYFAQQNQRFQVFNGENLAPVRFRLDPDYLVRYLVNWYKINRALRRLSAAEAVLRIGFEDDLASGRVLDGEKIFRFVGLRPVPVRWVSLRKALPAPEEMLLNFEECRRTTAETIAALEEGADLPEVYRRAGPSLGGVIARMARHCMRHPGALRLPSFWAPLRWKLDS